MTKKSNAYHKIIRSARRGPKSGKTHRFTKKKARKKKHENKSYRTTPVHDGIHEFCFKKFTSIHVRLSLEMNRGLQGAHVPDCMTKGKSTLIQKDLLKGTTPNHYRSITSLWKMWKILTAQIREEIYYSQTSCRMFPEEQKRCRKGSSGTGEFPYIDQHILNESKTRWNNLALAGLTTKSHMILQSWIITCLKMCKISDEVINFIEKKP